VIRKDLLEDLDFDYLPLGLTGRLY
jgi:hypothetical protein